MNGVTSEDNIRNECSKKVASIVEKMRENRLWWFEHDSIERMRQMQLDLLKEKYIKGDSVKAR